MDVNVYQHGIVEKKEAEAAADFRGAMESRRNRMSEIQELKNNRLVGEGRSGLLSIRNRPAGEYGDYVEKTVEAENLDREILMRHEAGEEATPIEAIREEQWKHRQRKSFPGEWIEVADEGGTLAPSYVVADFHLHQDGVQLAHTGRRIYQSGETPVTLEQSLLGGMVARKQICMADYLEFDKGTHDIGVRVRVYEPPAVMAGYVDWKHVFVVQRNLVVDYHLR
jgi:hypothetical protein